MNISIFCIFVVLLIGGCASNSYEELSDIPDLENVKKLPKVNIISPAGYDYYQYIFKDLEVFEEVLAGYTDEGLEIRIQRDSSPVNQEASAGSLMISAATLFLVPAVGQFEESLHFSVYEDAKKIKTYSYSTKKYLSVGLFSSSDSVDDSTISKKIDTDIIKVFIGEFSEDYHQL
ncbi:hypothetical protein AB835_10115 [Candidatus Endobugula sertula]|uniref:Uncharacterized protein n=1 Tax=Candidatus Endobugula sertula TaxID=62101 RepID=A0A1D2QNN0_9GAMM|nr:hypothetical protein AB835_10115 [Candidatus Endobugula sertula]